MDEEPHAILVVFVFQSEVYIVRTRRDRLETLELRTRLPELVVDAELQAVRALKQEQEAPHADLRVDEVLGVH